MAHHSIIDKTSRIVFVNNIASDVSEDVLRDVFRKIGPVVLFKLIYDKDTGKPKGCGYCEFSDQESALDAVHKLNNIEIGGQNLRLDHAMNEKTRLEMISMMQGTQTNDNGNNFEKAPETISKAVSSLPPEQMFELLKQMKQCVQNSPSEAKNMLIQNPQLAYALLQAVVVMRIVDPAVAFSVLNSAAALSNVVADTSSSAKAAGQSLVSTMLSLASAVGTTKVADAPPPPPRIAPPPPSIGDQDMRSKLQPPVPSSRDQDLRTMHVIKPSSIPQTEKIRRDPRLADSRSDPRLSGLQTDPRINPKVPGLQAESRLPTDPRLQVDSARVPVDPRLQVDSTRVPGDPRLQVDSTKAPADPRLKNSRPAADSRVQTDLKLPTDPRLKTDPRLQADPRLFADQRMQPKMETVGARLPYQAAAQNVQKQIPGPPIISQNKQTPTASEFSALKLATGSAGNVDNEKAALIMQVLKLTDAQIAMLPAEQRQSIVMLKEQIAKSSKH